MKDIEMHKVARVISTITLIWAGFCIGFGILTDIEGIRTVLLVCGVVTLLVWLLTQILLRRNR